MIEETCVFKMTSKMTSKMAKVSHIRVHPRKVLIQVVHHVARIMHEIVTDPLLCKPTASTLFASSSSSGYEASVPTRK